MNKFLAAAALVTIATASTARSYDAPADPPVMPPVIIEDQAASSSAPSGALVMALTTIVVFGAALAN